ncbi:MAG: acetyl/propionyl/methylcrotonyl-CoA carboxylase subunit alpha [Kineosporiaceae bacterium]
MTRDPAATPGFDTVLVANRGEIAVRIMRTLRAMGLRSVAVYSDADADARHVAEADTAVRIGPAPARLSYLDVEAVVGAAVATGAGALHPGYGFLSENPALAHACEAAGIAFVGPPVAAIEAMADKITAKGLMARAGVPVVPGVARPGMTDPDLVAAGADIGFPVLVKPSAGGGGKGMRRVDRPADLPAALASARREAAGAFGDDTLFLERFVERPRHVEVQVLADGHGRVLHLGERECSLQRRHQKVVEEAPSPVVDAATRERIGEAACRAAAGVGYRGAGTVEFIVAGDRPEEFFFLEMNTRLQVEHPVTELVTGVDLVEWQVRIARGEPLTMAQEDVRLTGHAVEARVYAEDPGAGFLPTGGRVLVLREPVGLPGVRVDSGLREGTVVGSDYDPMLAKVVAHGPDRATALRRLHRALAATRVLGVRTNVDFVRHVLADPDVVSGRLDTALLDRIAAAWTPPAPPAEVVEAAAAVRRRRGSVGDDPWDTLTGWRIAGTGSPPPRVVPGLDVADAGGAVWVAGDQGTWRVAETTARVAGRASRRHDDDVRSPMPGTVTSVAVASGDAVGPGDAVVVVEAMKMEHTLRAATDGTVEVTVAVGDTVAVDQVLARVHPPAAA